MSPSIPLRICPHNIPGIAPSVSRCTCSSPSEMSCSIPTELSWPMQVSLLGDMLIFLMEGGLYAYLLHTGLQARKQLQLPVL